MTTQLRCTLSPGQFSNEYCVSIQSFNGRNFSLFASRDDVQSTGSPTEDQSVDGWLNVEIVNQTVSHFLVRLPQSTLENGQHISVSPSQLRGIPASKLVGVIA
jgi:hypothetical protein